MTRAILARPFIWIAAVAIVTAASAQDVRGELHEAARLEAARQLERSLELNPRQITLVDDWAFVLGQLHEMDGSLLDLTDTHLQAPAGAPWVFCALFRHEEDAWQLVETCLAPADVAWEGWPARHGAPEELFRPSVDDLAMQAAQAVLPASAPEFCAARSAPWANPAKVIVVQDEAATSGSDGARGPWLRLVRFTCTIALYNTLDIYFLVDSTMEATLAQFATPEISVSYEDDRFEAAVTGIGITGYSVRSELANSWFDAGTGTMHEYFLWRVLDDASSSGVWELRETGFSLVHYAVDASYDGEWNPEVILDLLTD